MILFRIISDNVEISTHGALPLGVYRTKGNEKSSPVSHSLLDCLSILVDGEVQLFDAYNVRVGQTFSLPLFRF